MTCSYISGRDKRIPSHANGLIILEFKIMLEEGSTNVVILK